MKKSIICLALLLAYPSISAQKNSSIQQTDKNGLAYTEVKNDPSHTRIYTLKNGLKVFLSKNNKESRIQTYIAVRAGSNNDPADNTGLAHYLEHMLSKGTHRLGTTNWAEEAPLIEKITQLYDERKAEPDPEKKKLIYQQIDELSQKASQYAIAREGHKIMKGLGATGTNAHTWLNETIYKNNIPSNELERWMKLETERFSSLVFRLFSTEIEAVYEEFNILQDNDDRQVSYRASAALFPQTAYGTQTTLGTSEHLKNPSIKSMAEYHKKYYVPNNMAVCLAGDLDYEPTIQMLEKYFGQWQPGPIEEHKQLTEAPLTKIQRVEFKSPSTPKLQLGWRLNKMNSQENLKALVVSQILNNSGKVGLIDLNLIKPQALLSADNSVMSMLDFSTHSLVATPKDKQTLEQAEALLLEQINLIKQGKFEDWMLEAITNNLKKEMLTDFQSNEEIAIAHYRSFINRLSWEEYLSDIDRISQLTKADIVKFANDTYKDNYVAVYKIQGPKEHLIKVDKPKNTPIKINREAQSEFAKSLEKHQSKSLSPVFLDFSKDIKTQKIASTSWSYVANKNNALGQLHLVYPIGRDHDKKIRIALSMTQLLDSKQQTVTQFKQKLFRLGVDYDTDVYAKESRIIFSGLDQNIPQALALWEEFTQNISPNQATMDTHVEQILTQRKNAKTQKDRIEDALMAYAQYGPESRFRDNIPENELKAIKSEEICDKIKQLKQYQHEIYYYGQKPELIKQSLSKYHQISAKNIPPAPKIYSEQNTSGKVYLFDYNSVQIDIQRVAKSQPFKAQDLGYGKMYNNYFGGSFSSIIFQEIREAKGLAYSAYSSFLQASEADKSNYVIFKMATQSNKLAQAVDTVTELFGHPPKAPKQFDIQKSSLISEMNSYRIDPSDVFYLQKNAKKWGINSDPRRISHQNIQQMDMEKFNHFFDENVKNVPYNTTIMGKKQEIDMQAIQKMGQVQELTLQDLFNY